MRQLINLTLGVISLCYSFNESKAIVCPLVHEVISTMKCIREGTNLYNCHLEDHRGWSSNFQSQVDITRDVGANQFVGRVHNKACTYTFQNPTQQIKYEVIHK